MELLQKRVTQALSREELIYSKSTPERNDLLEGKLIYSGKELLQKECTPVFSRDDLIYSKSTPEEG